VSIIRAYCYASGLIGFGTKIPKGALVIARGPEQPLREFIEVNARHGYRTKLVNGRPSKIRGSDTLLVPGLPEAENQHAALDALHRWMKWIGINPPKGVRVHVPPTTRGDSSSRAPAASTVPEIAVSNPRPAPAFGGQR
jgi:hypothetical protein